MNHKQRYTTPMVLLSVNVDAFGALDPFMMAAEWADKCQETAWQIAWRSLVNNNPSYGSEWLDLVAAEDREGLL